MNNNQVNPIPDKEAKMAAARSEKVQGFQLNITLEEDLAAIDDTQTAVSREENLLVTEPEVTVKEKPEEPVIPAAKPKKKRNGCLSKLLYGLTVVAFSAAIAVFVIIFLIDMVALNRSDKPVDIEIPAGSNTSQIADILQDKGIIDYPLCFRIFSKLTRSDGKYQKGVFSLTPNMGYSTVVDTLQTMTPRETVTVTIPEGFTIDQIAKVLEENNVCEKKNFFEAVITANYDYDFIRDIPTAADGEQYEGRIYLLEGYLFPDTYNFYVGSSGETVVNRMLENFNTKLTPDMRAAIQGKGMTIDEAIIMASIIQGEAASKDDMRGVSRVLFNRMEPNSGFPKLQCDSTGDYVKELLPSIDGIVISNEAYDTYVRDGLPAGAINNPGLDAIRALLDPSTDETIKNCYYFATDYDTGITYFTKTYAQHQAICRRYGIGMYG